MLSLKWSDNMKLTAVKCPNCKADIEINENLEKTICQYCGSRIS